jgi:hypothetical protein
VVGWCGSACQLRGLFPFKEDEMKGGWGNQWPGTFCILLIPTRASQWRSG